MTPGALGKLLDFVLRLAFFAVAPLLIVRAATLYPLTGALAQIGLALAGFVAGETAQRLVTRSAIARFALSHQREFDAYYRAHPPRPFLYYVFYPLLAPYWLTVRDARAEFLLFKGYTLWSLLFLLASSVVQYFQVFPPELSVAAFLPIALRTLLVETVVVLMFLMPIVTTVVHFHTTRAPRRLILLLAVGFTSVAVAVVRVERRRDPVISYATRDRVILRSDADPHKRKVAMTEALQAAWKILPKDKSDVDTDGKVEGAPLEKAHEALVGFFKNDEAYAFDLWYTHSKGHSTLVLYFPARKNHVPIWLAMDRQGNAFNDDKRLPSGAFMAMRAAAQ